MPYPIEYQVVDYSSMMANYGLSNRLSGIKWIIAHETANGNSTIDGEVSFMKRNANNAFVTHFVGGGGRIIQTAPVGKVCWGAGGTANSYSYAQIELCRAKDQATFRKDYASYIWLLRFLADECGIPKTLDTESNGIKSHAWVSAHYPKETNHTDPFGYLNSMGVSNAQFAKDIANGLDVAAKEFPWTKKNGKYTPYGDTGFVRDHPIPSLDASGVYYAGQTVTYDSWGYDGDYVWIHWIDQGDCYMITGRAGDDWGFIEDL